MHVKRLNNLFAEISQLLRYYIQKHVKLRGMDSCVNERLLIFKINKDENLKLSNLRKE